MSTGVSTDLKNALGLTGNQDLDSMSQGTTSEPYVFATDWEISSVDGLYKLTSDPYCEGDVFKVEMRFSGAGSEFPRLRDTKSFYTINSSQNCSLQSQVGREFTFEVDSGAAGSTNNEVGITFDNAFSSASGVGTKQTTNFDVDQFGITCNSASYDNNNDNLTITYTIKGCGTSDYTVSMYRDNDGSSGGPTFVKSKAKSSTGQHTITDTNPNSGNTSDEYRLDIEDSSSNTKTDSCTITALFST